MSVVDHKAEALRGARQWAEAADREAVAGNTGAAHTYAKISSAYSNLAIAEGQERVAEALEQHVEDQRKWAGADPRWKS